MLYTNRCVSGKPRTRLYVLAVCACFVGGSRGELTAASGQSQMVRSTDASINGLLAEGYVRSRTFRGLVDAIQTSDTIVYVEYGVCAFGHLDVCLLPFVANAGQGRYLRVVLTTRLNHPDRERLIALMGHELQHALEIAVHPEVVDVQGMLNMNRRIGVPLKGRSGYETAAAHAVENAVLDELLTRQRIQ